jgi:hypothetical protein
LNAQITTLENSRNVKDSEYQNKITNKYGDIAQKDNAIISKQGEINTVNSSISTIIGQINPNKQKLLDLLKENTTLVKEWKALLRNESHYFLDNAELLIYQDLYTDWEKLANNVTAPFLNNYSRLIVIIWEIYKLRLKNIKRIWKMVLSGQKIGEKLLNLSVITAK